MNTLKPVTSLILGLAALLLIQTGSAQVPGILKYQGRIAVNGVNFEGNGQFKFALVNSDGTSTFWSNDGTASGEPATAVTLTVVKGLYDVQLGDTSVTNMTTIPASVFNNPDVRLRVWFNDGTANGWQQLAPDERIASVGYAMVAATVPDGSITATKLAPGVGDIPNGSITADKLAPGAAAGNLTADNLSAVPVGGIIASGDPASQALLDQGYVALGEALETPDRWTEVFSGENAPAGHTAVWTGTEAIFWGGYISNGNSTDGRNQDINRGVRYNPTTETWTPMSTEGAPSPRRYHVATWTGSKMIVWGGQRQDPNEPSESFLYFNDGASYDPSTDTWTPISSANAPSPRIVNQAIWTGSEMIVFGGSSSDAAINTYHNDGGFYDPLTDTWTPFTAPWTEPRTGSAIAWTGTSLIVWDSQGFSPETPRGGRYFPGTNSWAALPRIPGEEELIIEGAAVAWTGTQMILWSGLDSMFGDTPSGGFIYTLGTNSWAPMETISAPAGSFFPTTAWTGSKMVVWGGASSISPPSLSPSQTGGIYDPSTDSWEPIVAEDGPASRYDANLDGCWTGTEMIVWGGAASPMAFGTEEPIWRKTGGRFNPDPTENRWTLIRNGSPAARVAHTAVWTGDKVIIWGGQNALASGGGPSPSMDGYYNDGGIFDPSTGEWTSMPSLGAPSPRSQHTAVWAGGEMLVWGGTAYNETTFTDEPLNSGAHYDPSADDWLAIAPASGPRSGHAAVWTGTEMIVCGGSNAVAGPDSPDVIEKYNPVSGEWTTLSNQYLDLMGSTNELFSLESPFAVWTGSAMYVIQGGAGFPKFLRYTPANDTWVQLQEPQPEDNVDLEGIKQLHWIGNKLLVVKDGSTPDGRLGALFDPSLQSWQSISAFGQPDFAESFAIENSFQVKSVWTGTKLLVFGGVNYPNPGGGTSFVLPGGGIYDPVADAWVGSLSPTGGPPLGMGSALWLGTEMFLWGGAGSNSAGIFEVFSMTDRGFRYRQPQQLHLYVRP